MTEFLSGIQYGRDPEYVSSEPLFPTRRHPDMAWRNLKARLGWWLGRLILLFGGGRAA